MHLIAETMQLMSNQFSFLPALLGIGSLALGIYSAASASSGQRRANQTNIQQSQADRNFQSAEAQKNREFQERMSSTAHQRQVTDMRKAGLNPLLSATGGSGASTPSGGQGKGSRAQVESEKALAANIIANTGKTMAETNLLLQKTKTEREHTKITDDREYLSDQVQKVVEQMVKGRDKVVSSGKNAFEYAKINQSKKRSQLYWKNKKWGSEKSIVNQLRRK